MTADPQIIVVGGGLAGLMATIKLAEAGAHVDLFSIVPVKRSHSVCAQGGINGAVNTKGEGDSPAHPLRRDRLRRRLPRATSRRCKAMADAAPGIIYLLDRMGVPFNRTPEGLLDFRRFGGTLFHRTAFAGATTGQQLLYALDEQVRRYEVDGPASTQVRVLGVLSADPRRRRRAAAASSRRTCATMEIRAFPADAVIAGDRRPGLVFGEVDELDDLHRHAPRPLLPAGRAATRNGEFIQVHPTAIPGADKLRLMSRVAPAAKAGACGCRARRATRARRGRSPRPSAATSSRRSTRGTATSCRATSPRARSSRSASSTGLGVGGERRGLPRPHAHPDATMLDAQARRHPRDLREVRRRRPARRADEDLPGRPLLDGRPVGRLRDARPTAAGPSIPRNQ